MFSTSRAADPLIPEFHARSRLAVARDVVLVILCVALVLAFLAEVWSARPKPSGASTEGPRPPPALVAPASAA